MHAVLYVCLPRSEARNSVQARKAVSQYLDREGFSTYLRFSGRCDYFSVGGRWSGRLSLLRLRHENPKKFSRFWKRFEADQAINKLLALFQNLFPGYKGRLPFNRNRVGFYGSPDDAQVMDEALFQQLKRGFNEEVDLSYVISNPNVIFTDDEDIDWPTNTDEAAKFWVVIIDYHF